jgi:spore maturation protein CgeB
MTSHLRRLLGDESFARALAEQGRRTVLARHTCRHRVEELLQICARLFAPAARERIAPHAERSAAHW